jgi:hypothetical protein
MESRRTNQYPGVIVSSETQLHMRCTAHQIYRFAMCPARYSQAPVDLIRS